jgi:hypothetical protein
MFDVFYIGKKPDVLPHERCVDSIEHARSMCRTRFFWLINYLCDYTDWDWFWEPPPWQRHQRHAWPSQWQKDSGTYLVPCQGYSDTNYQPHPMITRVPNPFNWIIPDNVDIDSFDFSWHPDPTEPDFEYHFGTQWQSSGGPIWPGTRGIKRLNEPKCKTNPVMDHWIIPDNVDIDSFDFSWHPDPTEPEFKYEFATTWHQEGGPVYNVPGSIKIKYISYPCAKLQNTSLYWKYLIDVDQFDRSWSPHPKDPPYIYVFGNQWHAAEIMPTVEYHAPGATEKKYMTNPVAMLPQRPGDYWKKLHDCDWDYSWIPHPGDPPYIYVFGNQWHAAEIMPTVEYHVPGATEKKYIDYPRATLRACQDLWFISENVNVTGIDFSWVPDPGEPPYIYQFATQHQKTGGPQYRVPGATEIKYLEMLSVEVKNDAIPIVEIDHLDGNVGQVPNTIRRIRYFDNYRDTLIRLAKSLIGQHEHVWVISSICDYNDFDFSWHPEIWQRTMLHVFASDDEKFGDTFYMHVPTFAERAEKKKLLEWYAVNFVPGKRVPRRPMPVFQHDQDSHVGAVKSSEFTAPLVLFTVDLNIQRSSVTVPLWRQEVKTIVPLTQGAEAVIVPKAAVGSIRTQLYDYPYIEKTKIRPSTNALDIVFISNGEPNAEQNWKKLCGSVRGSANRVHHIHGVKGRVAAYQAAAQISVTPWFFAVFAKLEVNSDFDWSWQPDRMQQPKHYIFHARNPVNGLVYGHQAMIAYNRRMVMSNIGQGLDFTLDQPHEVVPLMSGTARYADSAWMAWRTAFREVIKLRHSLPDVENEYRLSQWITQAQGDFGEWSRHGAEDALEYYDAVSGDFAALRKSYEWDWLANYALARRNLEPDQ